MRNDRISGPARPVLRSTLMALALFLAGPQSALAVNWATGSNGGNWIYLNPTSAEVGIGTSGSTNPIDKLTVAGGNIHIDNNRFFRAKLVGSGSTNLMGLDADNMLTFYNDKLTIQSNGRVSIGGFPSPLSIFHVTGKTTFDGQINVRVGPLLAEAGLQSLGDFWTKNATVNGDVSIGGVLNVNGTGNTNFLGTTEFWGLTETGNLNVFGNLNVTGSKNFVHPHPADDTKKIVYVAAEAGEALTLARGISRTEDGKVTVNLPDHFALVTSEEAPLTVQLTVEGAPALIYVVSKSRQAIEVKLKDSDFAGFGDVAFNYFVQGVRDGFEDHIAVQDVNSTGGEPRPSPKRGRYEERVNKAFPAAWRRSR